MIHLPTTMSANELIEYVIDQDVVLTSADVTSILSRVGAASMAQTLLELWNESLVTGAALAAGLDLAWTMQPSPTLSIHTDDWRKMFDEVAPISNGKRIELSSLTTVTLYRGASEENKRGIAWTSDLDVARSFASGGLFLHNYGSPTPVWTAKVPPKNILAIIDSRGEHEYVVETENLSMTLFEESAR